MSTTISGRFDNGDDARRGAEWLERQGISRDAIAIHEQARADDEPPGGSPGVAGRGATGARHWTVTVRTGDAAHRRLAADILRAAGAQDLDRPGLQQSGIGAAGSAFGMAIADAVTAPMSGVSASRAQEPPEDQPPSDATDVERKTGGHDGHR
jgi:hypothetical protein